MEFVFFFNFNSNNLSFLDSDIVAEASTRMDLSPEIQENESGIGHYTILQVSDNVYPFSKFRRLTHVLSSSQKVQTSWICTRLSSAIQERQTNERLWKISNLAPATISRTQCGKWSTSTVQQMACVYAAS